MDLKELFTRPSAGAAPASDDPVQAARTRARRRLVGAALLLVVGVVAFPLLFETKPRPLALDTPIVAGRTAATTPSASGSVTPPAPAARTAPAAVPPPAASAAAAPAAPAEAPAPVDEPPPVERAASAVAAAAPAAAPKAEVSAAPKAAPAASPKVEAAAAPKAEAVAAPKAAASAASAPRAARFVVQVGAFTEAATAREVRLKVEKLGLKTYTQVVDTEAGKRTRVRIGPFASREEAMQTLAKIQAANLPGVVLAL